MHCLKSPLNRTASSTNQGCLFLVYFFTSEHTLCHMHVKFFSYLFKLGELIHCLKAKFVLHCEFFNSHPFPIP